MQFKGLELDRFQEDAIAAIDSNRSVIVSAPTGSGKTLIADYIISRDIEKGIRVIYTAPIKALSNQKYKDFCHDYGEENIGLMTGDIVRNPQAKVLIMTTEIYRNMLMTDDEVIRDLSYVIFDEIHFISDIERGYVWEESIIFSKPRTRFLCLSATIPNAEEFAGWIRAIKGHEVEVIVQDKRHVPLELGFFDAELGIVKLEEIRDISDIPDYGKLMDRRSRWQRPKSRAPSHLDLVQEIRDRLPCLFFCFSRAKCERMASDLLSKNLFAPDPKILGIMQDKLREVPHEVNSLVSARLLRQTLPRGIAFHHAGLIPVLKDIVEELFCRGLIKVLYTTETFAVGINMPAKTVCFESLRKFDGIGFRYLASKEFFQIAGRAGRRGIDSKGYCIPMIDRRDFDYSRIRKIVSKDVEPIVSRFRMSPNTVLNMVERHSEKEIDEILCKSFDSFQRFGKAYGGKKNRKSHSAYKSIISKLIRFGYMRDGKLTQKGIFASRIYGDEFLIGEVFYGSFTEDLDEYSILLLLACISYEGRDEVTGTAYKESIGLLKALLKKNAFLKRQRRFNRLEEMAPVIHPFFHGKDIFAVIMDTGLPEGDLLRFYRTIIDKAMQVMKATDDSALRAKMENCVRAIREGIRLVDVL